MVHYFEAGKTKAPSPDEIRTVDPRGKNSKDFQCRTYKDRHEWRIKIEETQMGSWVPCGLVKGNHQRSVIRFFSQTGFLLWQMCAYECFSFLLHKYSWFTIERTEESKRSISRWWNRITEIKIDQYIHHWLILLEIFLFIIKITLRVGLWRA